MRYLFLFCLWFLAHTALAFEVPDYMRDAVITVKMKDGKTAKYSGNEWGVFKRYDKGPAKPKPKHVCPTCPACPTCPICPACEPKVVEKVIEKTIEKVVYKEEKKNAFSLLAGYGPVGLEHRHIEDVVRVTQEYAVIGGVRYTRLLGLDTMFLPDDVSFEALTNFNFLIGGGWRW